MSVENIDNDYLEGDMINPIRRVRAFMLDRIQVAAGTEETTAQKAATAVDEPPLNPAELRLKALQALRAAQASSVAPRKGQRDAAQGRDALPGPAETGGYWLPIGPFGSRTGQAANRPVISGRVSRIALSPDGTRVYLATANSGVWRSDDRGETWIPLMGPDFDQNPTNIASDSLSCGAIAVVRNPGTDLDTIYIGTGEGDAADGSSGQSNGYFGVGPIVLLPSETTWRTEPSIPSLTGAAFFEMAAHPTDPNLVIAATTLGVYRREETALGSGVYQWKQLTNFINTPGGSAQTPILATSLVVAHENGNTSFFAFVAFAAVSGTAPRGVFRSIDNGSTWTRLPDTGLPAQNRIGRSRLAVQANNPHVVYFQIVSTGEGSVRRGHLLGVFRFETSDNTWRRVVGVPNTLFGTDLSEAGQGRYDNAIAVDPMEVNRIFVGGSTISSDATGKISTKSGTEWSAALYRCEITVQTNSGGVITQVRAEPKYIGGSVHADVHAIVFPPNDPGQLWVGCDGGVFHTRRPRNSGMIFRSCNHGLQTLTMQSLGIHPVGTSVLFCGTQDNGAQLYTGQEVWQVAAGGDCGHCVVNWDDPKQVVNTYVHADIRRSIQYGNPDTYRDNAPAEAATNTLFYAPLVGPIITTKPTTAVEKNLAKLVAFGARRLWLSENFGVNWRPVLGNTTTTISAIAFASATKIYVGNTSGEVFRYEKTGATWRRALMSLTSSGITVTGILPSNTVAGIAIDLADPNGDSIFITFAGILGNADHVWHGQYQTTPATTVTWIPKGGTTLNKTLPDIHHSAIVVDPNTPQKLYVANDLGVWHTPDASVANPQWAVFSQGLPDAAVIDLKLRGRSLLAATHGRGVFERDLDYTGVPIPVKLYVRNLPFDYGERHQTTLAGLTSPLNPTQALQIRNSPDIHIQAPDNNGNFRLGETPDFIELEDFRDDATRVPTHASAQLYSKVYVRIHNKGTGAAMDTKVMLLIAETTASMPPLPVGYADALKNGTPFPTGPWKIVGVQTIRKIRIGTPQVATFELSASFLPQPASLTASSRSCLIAVLHHPLDAHQPYLRPDGTPETNPEVIATHHPQLVLKEIGFVAFTGTLPPRTPSFVSSGYTAIPRSATLANAPFDAMLGAALRDNDVFFEQNLQRLLLAPFANNAQNNGLPFDINTGAPLDPNTILHTKKIEISAPLALGNGPLIWCAQESITIHAAIDASGKGASANQPGDFGGSGGGSSNQAGPVCRVPVSAVQLLDGGIIGGDGAPTLKKWASRAFTCLALCKGGGGGANEGATPGGAGGGVVVLCAPTIRFEAAGSIDASGKKGSGSSGGGGGGLVILIANEFPGLTENVNVKVAGGEKSGTGGAGGTGFILKMPYS